MSLIAVQTHTKKKGLLDYEKIGRKYPDWSTERKNTEKRIRDMGCSENISFVCLEPQKKRKVTEPIFKEILAESFLKAVKDIKPQISEALYSLVG